MEPSPGQWLTPDMRLDRILGRGAMGSVWVCRHRALDGPIAVKLMSKTLLLGDTAPLARFRREAKAAAQIESPHVVEIFDYGTTEDGSPYIVMELLDGETLGERLERVGVLPLEQVARIVRQVSEALGQAHELGIVHRDIKPDNIFLVKSDQDPFVKVLDFGTAKHSRLRSGSVVTATGVMVGTPEFMSPEQVLGSKDVDFRADLWALGVVAYRAITGQMPFGGTTPHGLCLAICREDAAVPSAIDGRLPSALDAWFERALARAPEDRFGSARQMALAFDEAIGADGRSSEAGARTAATEPVTQWPYPASGPVPVEDPETVEIVTAARVPSKAPGRPSSEPPSAPQPSDPGPVSADVPSAPPRTQRSPVAAPPSTGRPRPGERRNDEQPAVDQSGITAVRVVTNPAADEMGATLPAGQRSPLLDDPRFQPPPPQDSRPAVESVPPRSSRPSLPSQPPPRSSRPSLPGQPPSSQLAPPTSRQGLPTSQQMPLSVARPAARRWPWIIVVLLVVTGIMIPIVMIWLVGPPPGRRARPHPTPPPSAPTPPEARTPTTADTAAEALPKPGYLTIICEPKCDEVRVGNRSLGPSPLFEVPLDPGTHQLSLERLGSPVKTVQIHVTSGESMTERVNMARRVRARFDAGRPAIGPRPSAVPAPSTASATAKTPRPKPTPSSTPPRPSAAPTKSGTQ